MSWSRLSAAGLLLGAVLATVQPAQAIPAFARKYGFSCTMCHQPMPRLTAFGAAFGDAGFQFDPGEVPRDTQDVRDPRLRLPRMLPLAVRFDVYGHYWDHDGARGLDFQAPWLIKLLAGGQLADRISYYMYFFLTERGEVAGLEDAYLHFVEPAGLPFDVLVGQFQVSDPLFKRELRLEYEDYQPYRVRVGMASPDLTYDRGLSLGASPWAGGDVVLQVVNGRGLEHASERRVYDPDGTKNVAGRVSQTLGPLRIGGFVYTGVERQAGIGNRTLIWGPDATLGRGAVELNVQLLRRRDDNPFFAMEARDAVVDAAFGELIWHPGGPAGRLTLLALANWIESDGAVFRLPGAPGLLDSYRSVVAAASWLLATNVRVIGEGGWDLDTARPRATLGVVTAF
jgi:hypothetical protein